MSGTNESHVWTPEHLEALNDIVGRLQDRGQSWTETTVGMDDD